MSMSSKRWLSWLFVLGFFATLITGYRAYAYAPLIRFFHLPQNAEARTGDLTVNVTGELSPWVQSAEFRVNGGDWVDIPQGGPRLPHHTFTLEIPLVQIRPGRNTLTVRAEAAARSTHSEFHEFNYNDVQQRLPREIVWENSDLDVQDGYWETIDVAGEARVRPVPGHEGYDRILLVTGSFGGGRRIETSVTFRGSDPQKLWGFGVLPLWAGHPDEAGQRPRRGWRYGLAWFYSRYGGVGVEFADRFGAEEKRWENAYRHLQPVPNTEYRLIVEAWPEFDHAQERTRFRQRLKIWPTAEAEPKRWITIRDESGFLPVEEEYAVALLAHRVQAEFGPVKVVTR